MWKMNVGKWSSVELGHFLPFHPVHPASKRNAQEVWVGGGENGILQVNSIETGSSFTNILTISLLMSFQASHLASLTVKRGDEVSRF